MEIENNTHVQEQEQAPEAEQSLRDMLEGAFTETEAEPAEPVEPAAPPADPTPAPDPSEGGPDQGPKVDLAGRQRGPDGRFLPAEGQAPADGTAPAPEAQPAPDQAAATDVAAAEGQADPEPDSPPPQSWRPLAREEWGKLPPVVKQEIAKREHDMQQAFNATAAERKIAHGLQAITQPHAAIMQREGISPLQAAKNAMDSYATLASGDPQTKARLLAGMVKQFGVDVQLLDSALAGETLPGNPGNGQYPPPQPQMSPEQIAQMVEQRVSTRIVGQQAEHEVEGWGADKEFFNARTTNGARVRDMMANLMEMELQQGRDMSMDAAYNAVIRTDPQIASVIQSREQQAAQQTSLEATTRAKAAASSVQSNPISGQGPQTAPTDIRSSIEAAIESNE